MKVEPKIAKRNTYIHIRPKVIIKDTQRNLIESIDNEMFQIKIHVCRYWQIVEATTIKTNACDEDIKQKIDRDEI